MRTRHRRFGFTLLELSAVVALTSVLMLVAVALLRSVLDWSEHATVAAGYAANLHRMEQSLRQQLRDASQVKVDGNVLAIVGDQRRAEWTLGDSGCELVIDGSDGRRFERYEIGPREWWQLTTESGLVELLLDVPAEDRRMPFRVVVADRHSQPEAGP